MKNKYDINAINGNEVIDFLNADPDGKLKHYVCNNTFTFESQGIVGDEYTLKFSVGYNNWGTTQIVPKNSIDVTASNLTVYLREPFDGDGADEAIEKVLTEWFKYHTFNGTPAHKFYELKESAFQELGYVKFTDKEELDKVIAKLVKAKSLMK